MDREYMIILDGLHYYDTTVIHYNGGQLKYLPMAFSAFRGGQTKGSRALGTRFPLCNCVKYIVLSMHFFCLLSA